MTIEQQVREGVATSEKSQRQLAREAGISQPAVHKFLKKNMSLSGDNLQALAKAAGLTLSLRRKTTCHKP